MALLIPLLAVLAPTSQEYRPGAKLLIYRPAETNSAAPAIVFVHGGGWGNGTPEMLDRHCRYYATKGWVAISLGYRLTRVPGVTVFDCIADVTAGLRWIREQAGALGIDSQRIVLAGESAGGQLAWCAAQTERPAALVLYNPIVDTVSWKFVPGGPNREFSPIDHVTSNAPPTLLIHGAADTVVPVADSERFVAKLRAAGNTVRFEKLAGIDHAFLIPGYGDEKTIMRVLDLTDEFLAGIFAVTAVGDWGHFLRYGTEVFLANPAGRAFTVTVNVMRWPVQQWNPKQVGVKLTDPTGRVILDGRHEFAGNRRTFAIPAGAPGVYRLEVNPMLQGPDFFVESSLDQSVVGTGDPQEHAVRGRWLLTQCSVPRRWWFWVPAGTKSFTCRSQAIQNYQSQREDWGITIFSPRGQRVRMLWGDLDYSKQARGNMEVTVPVEPGAAGRFWSVELRFADSHNYSKVSFSLDGVPAYVARSPEEWFDPATGARPVVNPYDDSEYMQFARTKTDWLEHFSPCPALGDPDGAEVRGDAEFALWNPEDRPLKFRIGTYLPRAAGPKAHVKITDAAGQLLVERDDPLEHLHGTNGVPALLPATGKGVVRVSVTGVERWFAFTYPATPVVLCGQPVAAGWSRFNLEVGTARNWYFFVPRGTREFAVRVAAPHANDVMHFEINAPDRTVALIYGRAGEQVVRVPAGLDGKLWHLRPDIGSAAVLETDGGPATRYLGLSLTIDLRGVPGYLAPTGEQWFDPSRSP